MTNETSKITGLAVALILAASGISPLPVAAREHHDEPENAAADQKIRPLPGDKACLHHIAQYDEEGNFVGYKTERGPCR
jgi:hypothetical protein